MPYCAAVTVSVVPGSVNVEGIVTVVGGGVTVMVEPVRTVTMVIDVPPADPDAVDIVVEVTIIMSITFIFSSIHSYSP